MQSKQHLLTKEFLKKELIENNRRAPDIAKELNVSSASIYRYAKKFGIHIPTLTERAINDIINQRFGRLVVIGTDKIRDNNGILKFKCQCDCGNVVHIRRTSLVNKVTQSCGCLRKDLDREGGYEDICAKYFIRLKNCAESRNLEFNITIEDIWNQYVKQNKKCYLSGLDISFEPIGINTVKQTASVDRKNPKIGYTKENIGIVHKRVNTMKHNMTNNEFEYWIFHLFHNLKPNGDYDGDFTRTSYGELKNLSKAVR